MTNLNAWLVRNKTWALLLMLVGGCVVAEAPSVPEMEPTMAAQQVEPAEITPLITTTAKSETLELASR
ncbi:MAG: hypothetical protein KDA60_12090 [Planctomycetales bacterium]|nr:hypothetical protein [Planctomycetales bacterium]